jgi:DNA-binding GntR family transcriptional regulator
MARNPHQSRFRLANLILDVIREARFEPGHRLREQQIGDLLQVSRTPVRAALALLAERGIVESRPYQGYILVRPSDDLGRITFDVPATADQDLYDRLVMDRLAGEIPTSVTQSEVERRYDVDRAVLLRVLSRLAEDGLVARNEGRGWTFLPTLDSAVALRNSYDFRLTFEPAGFMLSTFQPDPAALERSRLQHVYFEAHPDIAAVDRRQLFEADAAFHEMCAEFSGNIFFLQAMQQQNRLRRLLEFGGYTNRRRVRDWCREHLAILDAVRAGARDEASALMRSHLSRAHELAPAAQGDAAPSRHRR